MSSKAPPVWVEIDLDAIAQNIRELRRIVNPSAELMAVVKADAYGHGAVQVAGVALQNGAARLGVARLKEGEVLRRAGFEVPILIFGYTDPADYALLIKNHLTQTIYSLQMAESLSQAAAKAGKTATAHIKIDSGMGRLGFIAGNPEAVREILQIAKMPNLDLEGVYTHFAKADFRDKNHAAGQWRRFTGMLDLLAGNGLTFRCRHAANSAAAIDIPETHLDMARPGLAIYGYYPNQEDLARERERLRLLPAMRWKASVSHVKRAQAGTGVSYGILYTTGDDTIIATIPVGYADGYNRLLSNRGEVLIHGQRCPVIGRICMDQFMVDANRAPGVKVGDEVVLIGKQGSEEISMEEITSRLDTIPHEVTCGVAARVPRHYLGAGRKS
jgi:alanine racemase